MESECYLFFLTQRRKAAKKYQKLNKTFHCISLIVSAVCWYNFGCATVAQLVEQSLRK